MGFPRNAAARALLATGNAGGQQAVEWLLSPAATAAAANDAPLAFTTSQLPSDGQSSGQAYPGAASAGYLSAGGVGFAAPGAAAAAGPLSAANPLLMRGAAAYASTTTTTTTTTTATGASTVTTSPWTTTSVAAGGAVAAADGIRLSAVGVAGLRLREEQKVEATGRAVGEAFQDLAALMAMAQTMVQLAEKFRCDFAAAAPARFAA